ncbi:MAG: hypothetical protein V1933_06750 [Candidatus Omnitrophota bacterium]
MTGREKLLRRVGLKCADFARQLSYHRALCDFKESRRLFFWISMYNNAIDLAVLDWFHLFGYHNDDLHWKKVVNDINSFRGRLLSCLRFTQNEWEDYRKTIKTYRDKDVAHIEVRPISHVPEMSDALKAADIYYKEVLTELKNYPDYAKWPVDLLVYHNDSLCQSKTIARAACGVTADLVEKVH